MTENETLRISGHASWYQLSENKSSGCFLGLEGTKTFRTEGFEKPVIL